jgi:hypothetical protein
MIRASDKNDQESTIIGVLLFSGAKNIIILGGSINELFTNG